MNILVSTTVGYNLGDEIIYKAVKQLLDELFPESNYFHYNRNPDLWHGQTLHGNYLNYVPDYIDLIVLAGTPEWYKEKMYPLYNTVRSRPIWAIGIGWGVEHLKPGEITLNALQKDNYRIIVRSEITKDIIPKEVHVLPCPSLIKSDIRAWHDGACFIGDVAYKPEGQMPVYCYTIEEFEKHREAKYLTTVQELFDVLRNHKTVYTSRLHAGFAGISMGCEVEFMKHDFRIYSALYTMYQYGNLANLKSDYLKILYQWKQLDNL